MQRVDIFRLTRGPAWGTRPLGTGNFVAWAQKRYRRFSRPGQVLRARIRRAVGPSGRMAQGHIVCGTPDPSDRHRRGETLLPVASPIDLLRTLGDDYPGAARLRRADFANTRVSNQHWFADARSRALSGNYLGGIRWAPERSTKSGGAGSSPRSADSARQSRVFSIFGVPDTSLFDAQGSCLSRWTRHSLRGRRLSLTPLDLTLGARHSRFNAFGDTTRCKAACVGM